MGQRGKKEENEKSETGSEKDLMADIPDKDAYRIK
jgi:hypothetical protein